LPSRSPIGRTGVTKSCYERSTYFSRTMENAVRRNVGDVRKNAVRPGRGKREERNGRRRERD